MSVFSVEEFDDRRYFAFMEYKRLKDNFRDFTSYVPLVPEHANVYSPKLSSLITDVCEQILDCLEIWIRVPMERIYGGNATDETPLAFENARREFLLSMTKRKKKHRSMSYTELHNFIKGQKIYEKLADLEENRIFTIPLQEFVQPFKPNHGGIPLWWEVYTSLKHDKYAARKGGTLTVSLHCLAALYRLVTYPHRSDSRPLLFAVSSWNREWE